MKKYYVVYWQPFQMGSLIHEGGHPLLMHNYDKIVAGVSRKFNIENALKGINIPKEAVCITWVTEMPNEPVLEPEFVKFDPTYLKEAATA